MTGGGSGGECDGSDGGSGGGSGGECDGSDGGSGGGSSEYEDKVVRYQVYRAVSRAVIGRPWRG